MKQRKIFNYIVPLLLIPLWLGLITEYIKEFQWLHYTVLGITTVLVLLYLGLTIHELRVMLDSHYNYQCRKMDKAVNAARKKLQRTIARTGDVSIMDYGLTKLREICPQKTYSGILTGMAEKEHRDDIKEVLLLTINETGENNEK